MSRFTFPLCSHLQHPSPTTPISSTVSIIDLKDVSLATIWSLRNHLQEASRLATDNYPETLGTIAVVNSPPFFPTVWGWVKVSFFLHCVAHFVFTQRICLQSRAGLTKARRKKSTSSVRIQVRNYVSLSTFPICPCFMEASCPGYLRMNLALMKMPRL